jgi:hypothetical protein
MMSRLPQRFLVTAAVVRVKLVRSKGISTESAQCEASRNRPGGEAVMQTSKLTGFASSAVASMIQPRLHRRVDLLQSGLGHLDVWTRKQEWRLGHVVAHVAVCLS